MEMNIIVTRVHFDMDACCIITVGGVSAFTVDTHAILQRGSGFLWDCLREGRVPRPAGLRFIIR